MANMIYDKMILGATFAAAGLLTKSESCLVIEPKSYAGYEFLGALHFGTDYDEPLSTKEAAVLYEKLKEKDAIFHNRGCLFGCSSVLYSYFLNKDVLLNTNIVSIQQKQGKFCVTTWGVSGFRTFWAKTIVNTLCDDDNVLKKSFHAWIRPKEEKGNTPEGFLADPLFGAFENTFIINLPIENGETYCSARQRLDAALKTELADFRLGLTADCFAAVPKTDGIWEKDGMIQMPSCGFKNPLLAFDAGVSFAKGGAM